MKKYDEDYFDEIISNNPPEKICFEVDVAYDRENKKIVDIIENIKDSELSSVDTFPNADLKCDRITVDILKGLEKNNMGSFTNRKFYDALNNRFISMIFNQEQQIAQVNIAIVDYSNKTIH